MSFYTFKRGSVVCVDFSPQIGSEIKGRHFAVVLTKRDTSANELLTVIPLTSKYHKYHLDLGDEIKRGIYDKIKEDIIELQISYCSVDNEKYPDESLKIEKNANEYQKIIKRYQLLKEHTYAKVHQITTISKKRILKPVNKYDPIRKLKVSNEVMDMLDNKILELFTQVDKKKIQ